MTNSLVDGPGLHEYGQFDGLGLAELIRSRQVSAEEVLNEALRRTESIDPQINAVVIKHYDYARQQLQTGYPNGPFCGVPFLLKDIDFLAGTRTTFGASLLQNNIVDHDSTLVKRFRDSGVVIFGKTATPELGIVPTTETRLFGPTRNPWDLSRSSGGSSGGAAAAVAARILPVAHATDGGGSIRIPAAACGIFGLKPTRARTPAGPDRGEGWGGFSCGHVVSISVRDSAAMLDAIEGPEPTSPYVAPPVERPYLQEIRREPGRLRVAFTDRSPYGEEIDPDISTAVRDVATLLERLGHDVVERAPVLPVDPTEIMTVIVGASVAFTVRLAERQWRRAVTEHDFERMTLGIAGGAQRVTAADYLSAQAGAFQITRSLASFFTTCDVFLSPTLCSPPLRIGELNTMANERDLMAVRGMMRRLCPGTSMFNISGQPAMSVPLGWSAEGLPLGMMFAARFGDEATLFRLAAQLEAERPWKHRRPPVCA
ncbi:amidase [Bradyrhizobium prioriisuperbiae]|uniref:amidase n=1 Tax=Bradyrhizobium prioriisuperbiae TaxID=2854389 RepID=UPI0028E5281D|nr:amidase [Bradyrhizobium prioritasuperba]